MVISQKRGCRIMKFSRTIPLLLLPLTSCETILLNAAEDARLVHEAGKDRVIENNDWRQDIRRRCRELVIKEAEEREQNGDRIGALRILGQAYPSLLTVQVYKDFKNNPETVSSTARECEVAEDVQ